VVAGDQAAGAQAPGQCSNLFYSRCWIFAPHIDSILRSLKLDDPSARVTAQGGLAGNVKLGAQVGIREGVYGQAFQLIHAGAAVACSSGRSSRWLDICSPATGYLPGRGGGRTSRAPIFSYAIRENMLLQALDDGRRRCCPRHAQSQATHCYVMGFDDWLRFARY